MSEDVSTLPVRIFEQPFHNYTDFWKDTQAIKGEYSRYCSISILLVGIEAPHSSLTNVAQCDGINGFGQFESSRERSNIRYIEFTPPLNTDELRKYIGNPAFVTYRTNDGVTETEGLITGTLASLEEGILRVDWDSEIALAYVTFIAIAFTQE
jgi:hypothetical protein